MNWLNQLGYLLGLQGYPYHWWQYCFRAAVVFLFGWLMIRVFARRAFGEQTPLDIVVAIVIGSNLSRALTGNARFFPTLAGTAAMLALYWLLYQAAARSPRLSRWLTGKPVTIALEGNADDRTMKRFGVGHGDIDASARRQGLEGLAATKRVVLERNGKLSILPRERH